MSARSSLAFNHNGGLSDDPSIDFDGVVTHPELEDEVTYQHVTAHQCSTCFKFFTNFKGLQQHMIIHTDERPFRCEICSQTFRFKSNLFEHQSVHTGLTPYSCPYCQKMCRLKGNLKKHLRTHVTTKEELEAAWRPFAKNDVNRRKSTPYGGANRPQFVKREPFSDVQDDNSVLYPTSSNSNGGFSVPRLRKKSQGLGTVNDWIKRLKNGDLLPQVELDEKIRRFEHYVMSEHPHFSCHDELLEVAKAIAFETHHCPVCNLIFMNKDDCNNHCRVEHTNMRASNQFFCEKCFRSFVDKSSYEQHEKYHERVSLMIQEGQLASATSEPELLLPENEQLQDIIQEAMTTMMLQQNQDIALFDAETAVYYQ